MHFLCVRGEVKKHSVTTRELAMVQLPEGIQEFRRNLEEKINFFVDFMYQALALVLFHVPFNNNK
jgi:hypothetical protein